MKSKLIISSIILLLFIAGCSKYQKLLKSTDNDKKYDMAMKYYEHKDYYRALQLFDQLLPVFRGTAKAEKIAYSYAYCYYEQGQYELASYQFNTFTSSFPRSEKVEECTFMSAYCKYLESPSISLDQSNTQDAIKQLQLFVNLYPNSKRINECNELIDKLRFNLESKAFEIAKLYYKIEDYTAAVTSFKSMLKDYPDTKFKEEALFDIIKANYKLASNSITSKKTERYESTIEAYNKLKNNFPNSSYMKESNIMNKTALREINKYKNLNSEKL
jgi:outer membrane protein assembly factor BamD